jgi:hypothetical protein
MAITDPMGIDLASCNGKTYLSGIYFLCARSGISWKYVDELFEYNKIQAYLLDVPFIAYHVFYPGQPIADQLNHFLKLAGRDCFAYSWDLELDCNQPPEIVNRDCEIATNMLLDMGFQVINYSRYYWIRSYLKPGWLNICKWWLAQFMEDIKDASGKYITPEHPGPVSVPDGIDPKNIWIHQSSQRMLNKYGNPWENKYLDCDRWIGDPKLILKPAPVVPEPRITFPTETPVVKPVKPRVFVKHDHPNRETK